MVLVILAQSAYGGSRDRHRSTPTTAPPERRRHTWVVRRPRRGADRGGEATWAAAAAQERGGRSPHHPRRRRALRPPWTERTVSDCISGALGAVEPCRRSGELAHRISEEPRRRLL